jgi:hypothetical protein
MEFKKNGDIIFDGADRVSFALVKELHNGNWEKAIDHEISLRTKKKPKESDWSEDLARYFALYGLHTYSARKKWPAIKVSLDFLDKPIPEKKWPKK